MLRYFCLDLFFIVTQKIMNESIFQFDFLIDFNNQNKETTNSHEMYLNRNNTK